MQNSNEGKLRNVHLTADAVTKQIGDSTLAEFSVAKNNSRYDKTTQQWVDTGTYFFDVKWWNPSQYTLGKLLKGQRITMFYELTQEVWQDKASGGNRSRVVLKCEGIDIIERPPATNQNNQQSAPPVQQQQQQQNFQQPSQPAQQQNFQQPQPPAVNQQAQGFHNPPVQQQLPPAPLMPNGNERPIGFGADLTNQDVPF